MRSPTDQLFIRTKGTTVSDKKAIDQIAAVDAVASCQTTVHRPDDDNRCKDCGAQLSWLGPGPYDWTVA